MIVFKLIQTSIVFRLIQISDKKNTTLLISGQNFSSDSNLPRKKKLKRKVSFFFFNLKHNYSKIYIPNEVLYNMSFIYECYKLVLLMMIKNSFHHSSNNPLD